MTEWQLEMSHNTHMNESCHTYEWVMSHIWMSHDTHMNESRHIYECVTASIRMSQLTTFDSSVRVTWPSPMAGSWAGCTRCKHDCMWPTHNIWLIRACDVTQSHVCHDSLVRLTWRFHMCDMTHSHVWLDSFLCVTWLIHMGWLRLVGSLNYRSLLQNIFSFIGLFCKRDL